MDLDDGERYAAAALFTLALHTTQVETGVDESGNRLDAFKAAWGCPDEELFDDLICVPENEPWPGMEVPKGFWGFDSCAPQGLCRRVYRALGITETRWPGLLKMPDVSAIGNAHEAQVALVKLVRRYGALLDPTVAPLIDRAISVQWGEQDPAGGASANRGKEAAEHAEQQQQQQGKQEEGGGESETSGLPRDASQGQASASSRTGAAAVDGGRDQGATAEEAQGRGPPSGPAGASGAEASGQAPQHQVQSELASEAFGTLVLDERVPVASGHQLGTNSDLMSEAAASSEQQEGGGPASVADGHASPGMRQCAPRQKPAVAAPAATAPPAAAAPTDPDASGVGLIATEVEIEAGAGAAGAGTGGAGCDGGEDVHGDATALVHGIANSEGYRKGSDGSGRGNVGPHDPTHQSVLALYELIGACLGSTIEAPGDAEATAGPTAAAKEEGDDTDDARAASLQGGAAAGEAAGQGQSGGAAEGAAWKIAGRLSSFFGGRQLGGAGGGTTRAAAPGPGGGAAARGSVAGGAPAVDGTVRVVRKPLIRWYDARVRVALRRFCHWLHIPAPKMHAMEQMWALQMLQLRPDGGFDFSGTAAGPGAVGPGGGRYLTYLKISAGALGGAALLALTGGLAAPAIAAGLGSAIVVFGGSTATAAAVTTLGGTAAGTAAITGTFGVIGASHAGTKTAALYGEVREFGFWSISAPFILPPPPSSADNPEEGDGGDGGPATHEAATAASAGPGASSSRGAATGADTGGALSSLSNMFRWRPKRDSQLSGSGRPSGDGTVPFQSPLPEQTDENGLAAPARPAPAAPPAPTRDATERPPVPPQAPLPGVIAGQKSEGGSGGDGVPRPPPPLTFKTRQSKIPSEVSPDGLFIPLELLGEECGNDGGGGGRSGGDGALPLGPDHPAALFRRQPVTPYPPRVSEDLQPPELALPATAGTQKMATAVETTDSRATPQQQAATPTAADAATAADAMAAAAPGSRRTSSADGAGGLEVAAHPLAVSRSPSEGGPGVAQAAEGGNSRRGSADGGQRVRPPAAAGASSASLARSPAATATADAATDHAATADAGGVRGCVSGRDSGCGSADGETEVDEGDPWVAELAASDRAAVRARMARVGADGALVDAVLAEMDAEAADLDGDGGRTPKPTAPPQLGSAASTSSGSGASSGAGSSRWSWFVGSKPAAVQGDAAAASAAAAAAKTEKARKAKAQVRPLLPVPIHPRRCGDATLALTIAVNGWVKQADDFVEPWRPLPSGGRELWALVWESDVLQSLGGALKRFIRDKAIEESSKMVLRLGVSAALVTAMALPMAVMSAINLTIGSRWRVALRRAQLGGRCLAHLLMQGAHGDRPVTLIGFSIGARLIFHCLLELSRCGARGLVESAVLLGTPVSANPERWAQARAAVSGRLVNAFSANDWVLGIIFRAHSRGSLVQPAAGLGPVPVAGIENINLSALIAGHTQYLEKLDEVLCALNLAEH